MNNINWLEQDIVVESITDLIIRKESFVNLCDSKMLEKDDKFNTDNKFEACEHEYWRTCKVMTLSQIKDLKEILKEITDVKLEEVQEMREAYEQYKDNRHSSYIGG